MKSKILSIYTIFVTNKLLETDLVILLIFYEIIIYIHIYIDIDIDIHIHI